MRNLSIRSRLAEENPALYLPYLAMTLNNLGILYAETQRPVENERRTKKH